MNLVDEIIDHCKTLERQYLCNKGNYYVRTCRNGIERNQTERRGTVNQNKVELFLDLIGKEVT